MSLFPFGKRNEEKTPACRCGDAEKSKPAPCRCAKSADGEHTIQVLGSGCKNCHTLLANTQEAVKAMGLDLDVEYVTDLRKIMESGVMMMPALVVDGHPVSMGKVLKPSDIEALLRKEGL